MHNRLWRGARQDQLNSCIFKNRLKLLTARLAQEYVGKGFQTVHGITVADLEGGGAGSAPPPPLGDGPTPSRYS